MSNITLELFNSVFGLARWLIFHMSTFTNNIDTLVYTASVCFTELLIPPPLRVQSHDGDSLSNHKYSSLEFVNHTWGWFTFVKLEGELIAELDWSNLTRPVLEKLCHLCGVLKTNWFGQISAFISIENILQKSWSSWEMHEKSVCFVGRGSRWSAGRGNERGKRVWARK